MRKNATYGLAAGLLCAALLCLVATTALAAECTPWYDDRLCGEYLAGFDGPVLYDMDVVEAPISMPEPVGWRTGHVVATGDSVTFTDAYGNEYAGHWHPSSTCYVDWDGSFDTTIVALCYDGDRAVDLWYATLHWDGHTAVMTGPWLFHIYIYSPPDEWPMTGMRGHSEQHSE